MRTFLHARSARFFPCFGKLCPVVAKLVKGDRQRHSQANRCARIAWRLCRARGASACILHDKLKRLPDYGASNNRPQERPHPSGRTGVGVGHEEDLRRRSRSEFATKHFARRGQISRAHTSKLLRETLSGVVSVKWLSRKSVTAGFPSRDGSCVANGACSARSVRSEAGGGSGFYTARLFNVFTL
jgi:hypothetical protein